MLRADLCGGEIQTHTFSLTHNWYTCFQNALGKMAFIPRDVLKFSSNSHRKFEHLGEVTWNELVNSHRDKFCSYLINTCQVKWFNRVLHTQILL